MEKNLSLTELKEIQETIQNKLDFFQNILRNDYNCTYWNKNRKGQNTFRFEKQTLTLAEFKAIKDLTESQLKRFNLITDIILWLNERRINIKKQYDEIIFGKTLVKKLRNLRNYNKISRKKRIENYINATLKKGDIPKTKEKDKTDYLYLQNSDYLKMLIDTIEERLDSYNEYKEQGKKLKTKSTDKLDKDIYTLTILLKDTQDKLQKVLKKKFIKEKPDIKTTDHITKDAAGEEIDTLNNISEYSNYSEWDKSDENPENYLDGD